jgi:hypothetical protein
MAGIWDGTASKAMGRPVRLLGGNDMTGRRQGTDPYLLVGAIVKARSSSRCVGTLSHHPIARPGNGRMVGREKHHDHPQRRRR